VKKLNDTTLQAMLKAGPAEALNNYFEACMVLKEDGCTAMEWLKRHRPAVRNSVLCYSAGVACYCVGASGFADQAPAEDHDKWFISVLADSDLDSPEFKTALSNSLEDAEAQAVEIYGLLRRFETRLVEECPY
jgi:hypothetical protein